MLSKHDRKSRTRITAGVTGAAALTLAGLALTASGTQAAANLRADVGDAIGVDLQDPPAPPAPLDAPEAPDAPSAVEAPEAPEAPKAGKVERRVTVIEKDGKKHEVRVIGVPEGAKAFVWSGDDRKIAHVPVVASAKCGAPKHGDVKIETKTEDGVRKIIVCTDRIDARTEAAIARGMASREAALARAEASREAAQARAHALREAAIARGMASREAAAARAEASREAAQAARDIARESRSIAIASAEMGKRHALLGLKMARRSIEAQRDLSTGERAAALKGIDEALREIETADND